jgi:hypothetical protein
MAGMVTYTRVLFTLLSLHVVSSILSGMINMLPWASGHEAVENKIILNQAVQAKLNYA